MIKKMTYILISLIGALSLSSCGVPLPLQSDLMIRGENAVRQFSTTDSAFTSYVEEFEQLGKTINQDVKFEVGDIPINFGNIKNESYQGVCYTYTDGTREVIIRKSWWDNHTDDYRRSLIFHELGHCRLDRDHLDETHEVNGEVMKISMMNSVIIRPRDYTRYTNPYHNELFTKSTVSLFEAWTSDQNEEDDESSQGEEAEHSHD